MLRAWAKLLLDEMLLLTRSYVETVDKIASLKVSLVCKSSKLVRYFDQRDLSPIETLRPLVAPSLCSGCSNYYVNRIKN